MRYTDIAGISQKANSTLLPYLPVSFRPPFTQTLATL